jgi:hypothetical protein
MAEDSIAEPDGIDWEERFKQIRRTYSKLMAYVHEKENTGIVPATSREAVVFAIEEVYQASGIVVIEYNALNCAVLSQAIHAGKSRFLELHPDLRVEMDRLLPPERQR